MNSGSVNLLYKSFIIVLPIINAMMAAIITIVCFNVLLNSSGFPFLYAVIVIVIHITVIIESTVIGKFASLSIASMFFNLQNFSEVLYENF